MMPVQFLYWLIIITMKMNVCCKIAPRQWNYGNRLQNLGPVRHIFAFVLSSMKGETPRKPSSTTRPQLWQAMKWQGSALAMDGASGNKKQAVKHWNFGIRWKL